MVARQEPPPVLCLLTESLILFDSDTVLYKFMFCDMYKYATKSTGLCCMCVLAASGGQARAPQMLCLSTDAVQVYIPYMCKNTVQVYVP